MTIRMALLSILIASPTLAEYRVYQYIIKNKVNIPSDKPGRVIVSTLDPVSYKAYHGGSNLVSLSLLRTWMCPGHTGKNKDVCPSPYQQLPVEVLP